MHPQGSLQLSLLSWNNLLLVKNGLLGGLIFSYMHWVCQYILGSVDSCKLICTFFKESDAVGEKEKPLSYLLEILHLLLLTDICGIRLIELQISDTSLKHTSALELLSALFKRCK